MTSPLQDVARHVEEVPACLLCGARNAAPLCRAPDLQTGLPGLFHYVRCRECGLQYQSPRPVAAAMSDYYPDTYLPFRPTEDSSAGPLGWLRSRLRGYGVEKRCRPLLRARRGRPPGRLLDIGCGPGTFLAAMRRHGWEVQGIESSAAAADYGRRVLGLEIAQGSVEALLTRDRYADDSFDAVTLWDVLEHLYRPGPVLNQVRRILRPDGLLLLRVPVVDSLDARLFGIAWAGLDPPRHLTVFSRSTLARMLTDHGFRPLREWSLSGSHASFLLSLRFAGRRRGSPGRLRDLERMLSGPVGALVTAPYFRLIDLLRLGPEWTVLAQTARKPAHD